MRCPGGPQDHLRASLLCAPLAKRWAESMRMVAQRACRRLSAHFIVGYALALPMSEKIFVVMGVERGSMPHPTPPPSVAWGGDLFKKSMLICPRPAQRCQVAIGTFSVI